MDEAIATSHLGVARGELEKALRTLRRVIKRAAGPLNREQERAENLSWVFVEGRTARVTRIGVRHFLGRVFDGAIGEHNDFGLAVLEDLGTVPTLSPVVGGDEDVRAPKVSRKVFVVVISTRSSGP